MLNYQRVHSDSNDFPYSWEWGPRLSKITFSFFRDGPTKKMRTYHVLVWRPPCLSQSRMCASQKQSQYEEHVYSTYLYTSIIIFTQISIVIFIICGFSSVYFTSALVTRSPGNVVLKKKKETQGSLAQQPPFNSSKIRAAVSGACVSAWDGWLKISKDGILYYNMCSIYYPITSLIFIIYNMEI